MARTSRLRRLQSLPLALSPVTTPARLSFAASRSLSTTCPRQNQTDSKTEPASGLPDGVRNVAPRAKKTRREPRTRLMFPPKRTEAIVEEEVKASDSTYVPATDMSQLEEIATPQTWWDQPGHFGPESQYKGFGSTEKIADPALLEVYLRRAVVEAVALKQQGTLAEWATKRWAQGTREALDRTLAVGIRVQDGEATLDGDVAPIVGNITSEAGQAEATEGPSADEAREMVKAWDPAWKNVEVDETVKFVLRKRLYQLTGTLMPDAKLGAASTVKHVLALALRPIKAPKLAEVLAMRSDLAGLANVTLHRAKIGMVEKETAVGRWKVIEEELTKRGLPLTTKTDLPGNKEKAWLMGKE